MCASGTWLTILTFNIDTLNWPILVCFNKACFKAQWLIYAPPVITPKTPYFLQLFKCLGESHHKVPFTQTVVADWVS